MKLEIRKEESPSGQIWFGVFIDGKPEQFYNTLESAEEYFNLIKHRKTKVSTIVKSETI